jgi:AcrR family transcriptional regulator
LSRGLTAERIVSLAIRREDEAGLDGLTMRWLAAELSVTPMALYWHFANKDALIEAMAGRVAGEIVVEDLPDAPWPDRLRAVLAATLSVLIAHPWMGALRRRVVLTPDYLHVIETLLDIMHTAGYDAHDAVVAVDTALDGVALLAGRLGDKPVLPLPEDVTASSTRIALGDLDAQGYPRIAAAADALTSPDPPAARDLVIEILVRGIEGAGPSSRAR